MSDSLPEKPVSGSIRIVRLMTGEELIGFVKDESVDFLKVRLPAALENYSTTSPNGDMIQFVKLVNYLHNVKGFEIYIPRTAVVYTGEPSEELHKMYETYLTVIQDNPDAALAPPTGNNPNHGLQLLNDLFNNEDFVNFVNDLMDNFENVEVELSEDDENEFDAESSISLPEPEEPKPQPKRKKRRKVKPEASKMPYNPDNPPEDPESWSDNPLDYL